ncbi:hypothetical protein BDR22DRAFT_474766 [Usnea florida]
MEYEKLVAYCSHELKLVTQCDIAQLIKELRMVQADANDTYTKLTNDKRVNAREIMSAYMLAWDYIEGVDGPGYGQRFWKRELASPDVLIWPKDQKRILRGVEQILIDLQDYSTIDRQKRKKKPTLSTDQEEPKDGSPLPPDSATRPPTDRSKLAYEQLVTNLATVPYHLAPVALDTPLGERAPSQKDESKRAATKESNEEQTPTKRALTPSYIPEEGAHQTWPAFGFTSVSKEGARVLRHRTIKIDSEGAPSKTTSMTAGVSKLSKAKADRRQNSAKKYANILSPKRSQESRIDEQSPKKTWKNRLPSQPNSLLTRRQAASAKSN